MLMSNISVMFKNCKFIKAVTLPKEGDVCLLVSVQRGNGYFEVLEKNSIVTHGFVEVISKGHQKTNFDPLPFDYSNQTNILVHDEIYKELHLRGYDYRGVFKGIEKCNIETSVGFVKWESNWVSFMDKMCQMAIISKDTRLLLVSTGIKQLIIDPAKHLEISQKPLYPVYVYKECNLIRSGGIEISGLQTKSISRRPLPEPVLEKHEFVSNNSFLELSTAIRVNTQIIIEINLQTQFKAVEIIDDSTKPNSTPLLLYISSTLEDTPIIISDLILSGENLAIPGIKVENVDFKEEKNLTLLIGTKLLSRLPSLKQTLSALSKNGFLLTREDLDFTPKLSTDFVILTEYRTSDEKLILLQRNQHVFNTSFIQISSATYDWLPKLQQSLQYDHGVVIYAKNKKPEGILGFINCLRREPSGSKIRCLFMMDDCPEFNPKNQFYSTQLKKGFAVNVYQNGAWGTYRHLPLEEIVTVESNYYCANVTSRGNILSLKWFELGFNEKTPLKKDQILVLLCYSSVNFKDIMIASGRLNQEATADRVNQECALGFEFSGKDSSGRRVMGVQNSCCLASHLIADTNLLWEVPSSWTLEEAATVPVVYSTVLYAFSMVGKLKQDTSVLIHSGTGGIGLAALNMCLYYKCEIFVTVGTKEKRDYLRYHYSSISENHIGNSRDTSFEEMIKTQTKGRGVDVILNSLSDDKLQASMRCLARGGKFIEIGKFDLANDTALNILIMQKEASFHGVMLDTIFLGQKDKKLQLVKMVTDGITLGYVKPLPVTMFSKEEVEASYRYMMTGKHIGKVLVKIRDEDQTSVAVPFKVNSRFNGDEQCSYVIVGGLGGMGLELVDWLVLRKAKKVVLVSRTGIQSGYQLQRIRVWRSYGVEVQISTSDVTTKQGCIDLITEANKLGSVDAIFNLAVVLKDVFFENQTKEDFLAVFPPKAQATIFLDEVTRQLCPNLRSFVVFSSLSSGRGNVRQTNYAMANSVMERVCEKRKKDGFPAVAIQWGTVGDVGVVSRLQTGNKELVFGGTSPQKISSCLQVLDTLLKQLYPVVSSIVVTKKKQTKCSSMGAAEAIAFILGIKYKNVSQEVPLSRLGMDSIISTEVMQLLDKDFEINLTSGEIQSLTFAKLNELEMEKKRNKEDNVSIHVPIVSLTSQLQEHERGANVFLLPGIDGVFKPFHSFTNKLKAHVFGLQYKADNIEQCAKSVLEHIEARLVRGNRFFLIGYSFGANVALEIVNILEGKGYNGQLVLIDGFPTYLKALGSQFGPKETKGDILTSVAFNIFNILSPSNNLLQHKEEFLKCKTSEDRIELGLSLLSPEAGNRLLVEKQAITVLCTRFKAMMNYDFKHEEIETKMHLLKAKHSVVKTNETDHLFKICKQPVKITLIDGDHVTILKEPELATYVNRLIDAL